MVFLIYLLQGYFRKGCVLEAMEKYEDVYVSLILVPSKFFLSQSYSMVVKTVMIVSQALAAFEMALQYNPQSTEVSRKIKRLGQLQKEKQRAQELENLRSNVDMAKHLESFKSEMVSPLFLFL